MSVSNVLRLVGKLPHCGMLCTMDRVYHRCGFTHGFCITGVTGSGTVSRSGTCSHIATCIHNVTVCDGFYNSSHHCHFLRLSHSASGVGQCHYVTFGVTSHIVTQSVTKADPLDFKAFGQQQHGFSCSTMVSYSMYISRT